MMIYYVKDDQITAEEEEYSFCLRYDVFQTRDFPV